MKFLALSLVLTFLLPAQPPEKQEGVDRIFSGFNTHTPGCAVGVASNGSVILKSGYGMADLERNIPITPDTVFESGSLAKQFTAMSLMLLAQQGKISLDDTLRKYLPELPDYGAQPTIRHVLSHVSGLREWRPIATFGGMREGTYVYNNQDLLQMAARQHALNFDPGTHYSYTNTGFNISTILVERVLGNGKTFPEYTQEVIFGPLEMTHTRWRNNFRALVPNRSLAYGRSAKGIIEQETPIENIIGAGGLLTTVGDLLLWNENFTHAKVGGPDIVKAQQTPAHLTTGGNISYAAGLVVTSMDGYREVSHSGSTGGYRTWLGRFPDQGVSVAVLCNSAQANPSKLGRDTARLWTGKAENPITSTYKVDPAKLEALVGLYRKMRDNTVAELKRQNGQLALSPAIGLTPVGPGQFIAVGTDRQYRFEEGTPVRMRMVSPDDEVLYERVQPAQQGPSDVAEFIGDYDSKETGSVLSVAAGKRRSELTLQIAHNAPLPLRPTFHDAFVTPSGSSILFIRNTAGKIVELSAGEDRVWDLRFARVR